jgi:solute carrier family 25 carnitine/acylcarnitine transporter 20/29
MADFIAGYISGAVGILIGNPLDVLKTRLQASTPASTAQPTAATSLDAQGQGSSRYGQYLRLFSRKDALRGVAVPVLVCRDFMLGEIARVNQYF